MTIKNYCRAVAQQMVWQGKGLLAADESVESMGKHLRTIGLPNTPELRRAFREALFSARGFERYISGVILYEETLHQATAKGVPFVDVLKKKGVLVGIKVDEGTAPLRAGSKEKKTLGLEALTKRLVEYKNYGVSFAKWRAVFSIGKGSPSAACIRKNTQDLAQYARMCQEQGIVPIVEPEVLMDGAHSIEQCFAVTVRVQSALFAALKKEQVDFHGIILKPNMIVSGSTCPEQAGSEQVADMTVECLKLTVPKQVAGIMFLSGGQSDECATANLAAMRARHATVPWTLSFSFGRALEHAALTTWGGKEENVASAQKVFLARAKANSEAVE